MNVIDTVLYAEKQVISNTTVRPEPQGNSNVRQGVRDAVLIILFTQFYRLAVVYTLNKVINLSFVYSMVLLPAFPRMVRMLRETE